MHQQEAAAAAQPKPLVNSPRSVVCTSQATQATTSSNAGSREIQSPDPQIRFGPAVRHQLPRRDCRSWPKLQTIFCRPRPLSLSLRRKSTLGNFSKNKVEYVWVGERVPRRQDDTRTRNTSRARDARYSIFGWIREIDSNLGTYCILLSSSSSSRSR